MARGLRIAVDLELPVDVVTQPIAILARRGAGKTYTASVFVEEVIRAKVPVVILDPTGGWWGLRSSVDGQSPGLPVVIFGGDHGDVPLEQTAGTVIADVVLEHPGAYVVDLSAFPSKAAEQRFAGDFLERLYRGKKAATGPLLLVVDEADIFAPQRPGPEQTRTLGALEAIVRRGRIKGLGDLLITQRAAVLNKNVLTQTEVLVAMQTTGPQDRAAIDAWIEGNGTKEEREEVLGSLASMARGEAWVWSPAFLRILQRVRIRERTTFDSSRTPEAGEQRVVPRAFASVDLEQLGERIRATAEQAKAKDPAVLQRRIAELERQARERPATPSAAPAVDRAYVTKVTALLEAAMKLIVEINAKDFGEPLDRAAIEQALGGAAQAVTKLVERHLDERTAELLRLQRSGEALVKRLRAVLDEDVTVSVNVRHNEPFTVTPAPAPASPRPPVRASGETNGSLGPTDRAVLATLASFPEGRTQKQVAILSGYSAKSGGFFGSLAKLRKHGLIVGGSGDLRITDVGLEVLGPYDPLPSGQALIEYWIGKLPKAEGTILRALIDAGSAGLSQDELGARTGYSTTSGGFFGALAKLRTLELIEGGKAALRAADELVDS